MKKSTGKPLWFEIHQLEWIPTFLKERQLEGIMPILKGVGFERKLLKLFSRLKSNCHTSSFLDLGSGAGNVVELLVNKSDGHIHFTLSDLHPRYRLYQEIQDRNVGKIDFIGHPVDISQVDGILNQRGITLVATFHELETNQAEALVKRLFLHSQGFLIAEPVNRSWSQALKFPLLGLSCFLFPLWARPVHFSTLFFTWVIPLLPLFHLHDGLVSFFRSFTVSNLEKMIRRHQTDAWSCEVGKDGVDVAYILAWRKT